MLNIKHIVYRVTEDPEISNQELEEIDNFDKETLATHHLTTALTEYDALAVENTRLSRLREVAVRNKSFANSTRAEYDSRYTKMVEGRRAFRLKYGFLPKHGDQFQIHKVFVYVEPTPD